MVAGSVARRDPLRKPSRTASPLAGVHAMMVAEGTDAAIAAFARS
jgi:hypothetical protein